MTRVLCGCVALFAAACTSTDSGGAVHLTFGDGSGSGDQSVFTTTPAGAAMIQGTFSASGDYEGAYTLATNVPSGSPLAACTIAVAGGSPSASIQLDASTDMAQSITVEVNVSAGYQDQAVCNVTAANNSRPNVGDVVLIQISGAN